MGDSLGKAILFVTSHAHLVLKDVGWFVVSFSGAQMSELISLDADRWCGTLPALGSTSRLQVVDPTSLRLGPTTQGLSTPKKVGPRHPATTEHSPHFQIQQPSSHFGPIGNLEQLASLRDLRTSVSFDGARRPKF
jgi:hypothetical protein